MVGWAAGDAGRRDLHVPASSRQRARPFLIVARDHRQHGEGRRAQRADPLQREGQSGNAAHHRLFAADSAETCDRHEYFRPDFPPHSDRLRPYRIKSIDPGQRIVFERRSDYWGKNLPSKIGIDNYDEITVNYFLQDTTLFEAFKKGDVDIYPDGSPGHWQQAYNFPAVTSGAIVKETFRPKIPSGMLGFVFNTRRPMFADKNVRKGLTLAFDFEWMNRNLYSGAYQRTQSYWQNSDLSSFGIPADAHELAMLGPIKDRIDSDVLDGTYKLPVSDGSGRTVRSCARR